MKLKIGARERIDGYKHLDIDPLTKPDILADVHHIPLGKSTCDEILCEHVLEHISDTIAVMNEFHRVLKPKGKLKILVPHGLNPDFWSTPDHVKGFTYTTFNQFWQDDHIGYPKFRCIKRKLIVKFKCLQFLADRFPVKVEKFYWLIPADEIRAELEPIK